MWSYLFFSAIRNVDKFCFGISVIVVIEIAILQNLTAFNDDSGSLGKICLKFHESGMILAEIHHSFSCRCMDDFLWMKLFFRHNRKTVTFCQSAWCGLYFHLFPRVLTFFPETVVIDLTHVDSTVFNVTSTILPAFICTDHFLASVLIIHMKLCNRFHLIPEKAGLVFQSESSHVPSFSK